MLCVGDSYIHFTKYGGINFGKVLKVGFVTIMDPEHHVKYAKDFIITEKGNRYFIDGVDGKFHKILKHFTDSEMQSIEKNLINNGGQNTSSYL